MNLTSNFKLERVAPDATAATTFRKAAGTSDALNSNNVDVLDYGSITFLVAIGLISATGTIAFTVEGSATGSGGWTAITGAARSIVAADADKIVAITVARVPSAYRYVRLVSTRATANSAIDSVTALLGDGRLNAPSHGSSIVTPAVVSG
jgi:hypothetical protein